MKKNKIAAAFDQPADDQKNKPEADHVIPVILGVDLANKFIQGCFRDPDTEKLVNRQYTRDRFRKLLQEAKYGQMTVVMEACGTSTYWGNLCRKYGHVPVIVPAQIVHAHNTGNKDDANDARYRKAAEQGFAPSQTHLASMYYFGLGVPKNHEEAVKWYRKAADQGNMYAKNLLGHLEVRGMGESKEEESLETAGEGAA